MMKEMHMHYDGGFMGGMYGAWWVFWLFWLLLIGALLYFVWGRTGWHDTDRRRETPHDVLRRRLASGEISPQEFEERKALLDRDAGGTKR